MPTEGSVIAGRRARALAAAVPGEGTLVVLLSGGASALMALPADGIALDDKVRVTEILLRGGAAIDALNAVRKHLSAIKGGRLAAAMTAPSRTLAISDVVGDDLAVIGSGPTVADASTFADALAALDRVADRSAWPAAVTRRLVQGAAGALTETPKPGDARLARHHATVIGGRRDAMAGAADLAARRGYTTIVLEAPVTGEARHAVVEHLGQVAALLASGAGRSTRGLCVISSGETTVRVTGRGRGGRNQEFVLAGLEHLPGLGPFAACASVGTDGVDGPTDAAGAIGDATSLARAAAAGLAPAGDFLQQNDSYHFFRAMDDLVVTGPTGTNVGDLQVVLAPIEPSGPPAAAGV